MTDAREIIQRAQQSALDTGAQPPDGGKLGKAMQALLPRQRKFVTSLLTMGQYNLTRAAAEAGYTGAPESLRVTGYRLAHDERVLAAIHEESLRRVRSGTAVATAVVMEIMTSAMKNSDRLKAAEMVMNRGGLPAISEHRVSVEHTTDEIGKIERITLLAQQLGIDPRTLLGDQAPALPAPQEAVDVEFTEVQPATEGLEDLL